jgi:hypothetical protein
MVACQDELAVAAAEADTVVVAAAAEVEEEDPSLTLKAAAAVESAAAKEVATAAKDSLLLAEADWGWLVWRGFNHEQAEDAVFARRREMCWWWQIRHNSLPYPPVWTAAML